MDDALRRRVADSAYVSADSVTRPGAPSGPLLGLRFAVKDMFDVRGHTASCGNQDWLRSHGPAESDAPCIQALLHAGAELVGMTVMDELAYSLAGSNAHYGAPINAVAPDRVTGGSSSGSAAVVAAGLVDFALGTDTGGSVRVPASYCGIHGLRPSHDRIALRGVMPLSAGFDTIGWFARDPKVLRDVGAVVFGELADTPEITELMIASDAMAQLPGKLRHALEAVARARAVELGVGIREVTAAPMGLEACYWAFRRIQAREIWACHGEWFERVQPSFGPGIRERFDAARQLAGSDKGVAEDARLRSELRDHMRQLVSGGRLLVMPPAAGPAPLRSATPAQLEDFRDRTLRLTCLAGLSGLPQLSMPALVTEAPVGISYVAASDEQLLALAGG